MRTVQDFRRTVRTKAEHRDKVHELKKMLLSFSDIDGAKFSPETVHSFARYERAVETDYESCTKKTMDEMLSWCLSWAYIELGDCIQAEQRARERQDGGKDGT